MAGAIAFIVAWFAYDPKDWLGFHNLAAVFLGAVAFCFTWPVLAIGRLVFVRRLSIGVVKTVTLWAGLVMFGLSLFVIGLSAFSVYRGRQASADRRVAEARLTTTHDVTAFHEPLSEQETDVVRIDVASNELSPERQVAVVKQFSHTLIVLRTLGDRPDVSPEALAALYDATMQRSVARDVQPKPNYKRDAEARGGTAYLDTLTVVREIWAIIGRNAHATPALVAEMLRSTNPYARMAASRNPNLQAAERVAYLDSAARSSSVTERAFVAADSTTPAATLRVLSADTAYQVRFALLGNPKLPADLRGLVRR